MGLINESRRTWLHNIFKNSGKALNRIQNNKLWQDGNHPVLLDTNTMLDQRLAYVHNNPVKAEIVDEPAHYIYSSARDYAGIKGLLDIDFF